jgi:hypothetical protein
MNFNSFLDFFQHYVGSKAMDPKKQFIWLLNIKVSSYMPIKETMS